MLLNEPLNYADISRSIECVDSVGSMICIWYFPSFLLLVRIFVGRQSGAGGSLNGRRERNKNTSQSRKVVLVVDGEKLIEAENTLTSHKRWSVKIDHHLFTSNSKEKQSFLPFWCLLLLLSFNTLKDSGSFSSTMATDYILTQKTSVDCHLKWVGEGGVPPPLLCPSLFLFMQSTLLWFNLEGEHCVCAIQNRKAFFLPTSFSLTFLQSLATPYYRRHHHLLHFHHHRLIALFVSRVSAKPSFSPLLISIALLLWKMSSPV